MIFNAVLQVSVPRRSSMTSLAQRVEALERELLGIKALLGKPSAEKDWRRTFGMSKDDAEFEEMVRLGREIREAECDEEH
jgi:hypothetical protein